MCHGLGIVLYFYACVLCRGWAWCYSDWQELMTLTHLQHICFNQCQLKSPGLHAARLYCQLDVVHGLQVLSRVSVVFLLAD